MWNLNALWYCNQIDVLKYTKILKKKNEWEPCDFVIKEIKQKYTQILKKMDANLVML